MPNSTDFPDTEVAELPDDGESFVHPVVRRQRAEEKKKRGKGNKENMKQEDEDDGVQLTVKAEEGQASGTRHNTHEHDFPEIASWAEEVKRELENDGFVLPSHPGDIPASYPTPAARPAPVPYPYGSSASVAGPSLCPTPVAGPRPLPTLVVGPRPLPTPVAGPSSLPTPAPTPAPHPYAYRVPQLAYPASPMMFAPQGLIHTHAYPPYMHMPFEYSPLLQHPGQPQPSPQRQRMRYHPYHHPHRQQVQRSPQIDPQLWHQGVPAYPSASSSGVDDAVHTVPGSGWVVAQTTTFMQASVPAPPADEEVVAFDEPVTPSEEDVCQQFDVAQWDSRFIDYDYAA